MVGIVLEIGNSFRTAVLPSTLLETVSGSSTMVRFYALITIRFLGIVFL